MLNETWRDQLARMHRSHALLKEIGERNAQPQNVLPPRDVLYHFCCDAFHLRDWIAATLGGTNNGKTRQYVTEIDNEVIRPSPELSACRDVANGFKHLELDGRSYLTNTNQGHAEVVSHNIGIGVPSEAITVTSSASVVLTHADGTTEVDDPVEPVPPPAPPPAGRDAGWVQDTFEIDILGQLHDAQDVATKAVAAWDQWLNGNSPLATQLRALP